MTGRSSAYRWVPFQHAERRVAGAEVVDGDPNPDIVESSQKLLRSGTVTNDDPLGDLHTSRLRRGWLSEASRCLK